MRRTIILLATLLTGVLVASGIALADTLTCTTNPCNGTENADLITGTDPDPTTAATGNDTINGLGGDDQISALGGNDRLTGGANNDTTDGGMGNDYYLFADSFGADRIEADSSGVDTIDFSRISTPISTPPSGTNPFYNGLTVDLVGPDPACDKTATHCLSLGGEFMERLVGTPFGDRLTGNSLNNNLRGGDGWDWLNGGAGNDKLAGGGADVPTSDPNYSANHDYYTLAADWGRDTIIDSGGGHDKVMPVDDSTASAMPRLTVNLVSDPNRPEFKDGKGNTVNWDGNAVEDAVTGTGADRIYQSPSDNQMYGGEGSDTYTGFAPTQVNGDYIHDTGGAADVLDLSGFPLWNTSWSSFTSGSGSNTTHYLQIGLTRSGCLGDNCQYINFSRYFDNTGTNKCAAGPGASHIETIKFSDDPNVDFAQVKSLLGCP